MHYSHFDRPYGYVTYRHIVTSYYLGSYGSPVLYICPVDALYRIQGSKGSRLQILLLFFPWHERVSTEAILIVAARTKK